MKSSIPPPARVPSFDTEPAPSDDALELMHELKLALANVGDLCTKLHAKLSITQLAVLTQEHKTNVHRDMLDGHELRLRVLEGREPESTAAE